MLEADGFVPVGHRRGYAGRCTGIFGEKEVPYVEVEVLTDFDQVMRMFCRGLPVFY